MSMTQLSVSSVLFMGEQRAKNHYLYYLRLLLSSPIDNSSIEFVDRHDYPLVIQAVFRIATSLHQSKPGGGGG